MITKDFYAFLESNGGELNICGIKFMVLSGEDIDIWIENKLYKWIRNAKDCELLLSDLTNVECGANSDFIEVFSKDYIHNETKITKDENERLQNEVNSLETENETLKSRLEKAKEEFAKMKDDVTKFEFLQQFLTTRDLIIHK